MTPSSAALYPQYYQVSRVTPPIIIIISPQSPVSALRMTRVVIIINWLAFPHVLCPKWCTAQLLSKFQSFPENSNKLFKFLQLWMHSCLLKVYISMGWAKGGIKVSGTVAPQILQSCQTQSPSNTFMPCCLIKRKQSKCWPGAWQIWLTVTSVKVFYSLLFKHSTQQPLLSDTLKMRFNRFSNLW